MGLPCANVRGRWLLPDRGGVRGVEGKIQEKSYGKLQAPSHLLLGLVQLLELRYRKVITNIISKENVKSNLSHELSKVSQLQHFKCDHCHQHLLIVHIMINIRLHHIIKGR